MSTWRDSVSADDAARARELMSKPHASARHFANQTRRPLAEIRALCASQQIPAVKIGGDWLVLTDRMHGDGDVTDLRDPVDRWRVAGLAINKPGMWGRYPCDALEYWWQRSGLDADRIGDIAAECDGLGYAEARAVITDRLVREAKSARTTMSENWSHRSGGEDASSEHVKRAAKYSVGASLTAHEWRLVYRAFHGSCAYCESTVEMQLDHIFPMSAGGDHSVWNVVPACGECNRSKSATSIDRWLQRRHDLDAKAISTRMALARANIERDMQSMRDGRLAK